MVILREVTGEVRPWRYDKLESEVILLDKPVGGRQCGVRPSLPGCSQLREER